MSLNDPRWGGQGGGDREDGNRGDDNRNDDLRGDRNRCARTHGVAIVLR